MARMTTAVVVGVVHIAPVILSMPFMRAAESNAAAPSFAASMLPAPADCNAHLGRGQFPRQASASSGRSGPAVHTKTA